MMEKSPEAVTAILETLRPRILAQLGSKVKRLVGARQDGMDLYQQVAYKVLKSLHSCRAETESELVGWIMTVAVSTSNRMLSANLRVQTRSVKREAFRLDFPERVASASPNARIEDEGIVQLEVNEEAEAVIKRMATISPRQREAVILYYMGGLTHDEIAERMGCNNQASRLLVSRGLSAIRNQMKLQTQIAS